MLDGLRGEESIAELCLPEGISQGLYYKWSKDFLEAGKNRPAGDITLQNRLPKKACLEMGAKIYEIACISKRWKSFV